MRGNWRVPRVEVVVEGDPSVAASLRTKSVTTDGVAADGGITIAIHNSPGIGFLSGFHCIIRVSPTVGSDCADPTVRGRVG